MKPRHLTSEHQRMARSKVSRESCARNGRLGAKATIAKHGFGKFFESWRKWKLDHPSQPELLIIRILDSAGAAYEREYRLEPSFLTLDFYLPDARKGIEFHGRIHGQLNSALREANDVKKRELLDAQGIETLWIDHTEMADVTALTERIRAFLAVESQTPVEYLPDLPF